MEKVINSYETMFIVDLDGGEAAVKATVDKFTGMISSNAELVEVIEWGKRRLAYPINDKNDGYYVITTFKSEPDFPNELERNFNIDEAIMRSINIRLDYEAVKHEKPIIAAEIPVETDEEVAAKEAAPVEETTAPVEETTAPVEETTAPVEETAAPAEEPKTEA